MIRAPIEAVTSLGVSILISGNRIYVPSGMIESIEKREIIPGDMVFKIKNPAWSMLRVVAIDGEQVWVAQSFGENCTVKRSDLRHATPEEIERTCTRAAS